jgi:hypothetical protein
MSFFCLPSVRKTKTAGGITKTPTSQSATASDITKQFVTVRNRLVVITDKITRVFPTTTSIIRRQKSRQKRTFVHGHFSLSSLSITVNSSSLPFISNFFTRLQRVFMIYQFSSLSSSKFYHIIERK